MTQDRVSAFEDAVLRTLERTIDQFTVAEVEQIKNELAELRKDPNRLPDDEAMVLMGRAYMCDVLERVSEEILQKRVGGEIDAAGIDDPRCEKLIADMGMEGYGIYRSLIEALKDHPDHAYSTDDIPALATMFRTTPDRVERVVKNYMLFDVEGCSEAVCDHTEGNTPYMLDRPFGEVLRERIDKLPDDERTKLYEAIDSGEPSDEVLKLSTRIMLGMFKEAYDLNPEAFMEAMGWDNDKTE